MERVAIDDLALDISAASVRRRLSEPLAAEHVAVNYYELEPGDSFAFGYHRHDDQEEVFVILDGTATFETESGDVEVPEGSAVRFAPGEFQRGWNRGTERVRALALGAPRDASGGEVRRDCPECGERTPQRFESAEEGEARITVCRQCNTVTGRFERGRGEISPK